MFEIPNIFGHLMLKIPERYEGRLSAHFQVEEGDVNPTVTGLWETAIFFCPSQWEYNFLASYCHHFAWSWGKMQSPKYCGCFQQPKITYSQYPSQIWPQRIFTFHHRVWSVNLCQIKAVDLSRQTVRWDSTNRLPTDTFLALFHLYHQTMVLSDVTVRTDCLLTHF